MHLWHERVSPIDVDGWYVQWISVINVQYTSVVTGDSLTHCRNDKAMLRHEGKLIEKLMWGATEWKKLFIKCCGVEILLDFCNFSSTIKTSYRILCLPVPPLWLATVQFYSTPSWWWWWLEQTVSFTLKKL
jgi:hypothetical protein